MGAPYDSYRDAFRMACLLAGRRRARKRVVKIGSFWYVTGTSR